METRLIYITTSNRDQARLIGRALVEERLAACVNIIDGMNSFYWWKGEIQDDQETVLIAKTKQSLVADLIARVRALHSYEVPCVVSLPVLEGNPAFLEWIHKETR